MEKFIFTNRETGEILTREFPTGCTAQLEEGWPKNTIQQWAAMIVLGRKYNKLADEHNSEDYHVDIRIENLLNMPEEEKKAFAEEVKAEEAKIEFTMIESDEILDQIGFEPDNYDEDLTKKKNA